MKKMIELSSTDLLMNCVCEMTSGRLEASNDIGLWQTWAICELESFAEHLNASIQLQLKVSESYVMSFKAYLNLGKKYSDRSRSWQISLDSERAV